MKKNWDGNKSTHRLQANGFQEAKVIIIINIKIMKLFKRYKKKKKKMERGLWA